MKFTRDFYVPKGATKVADKLSDAVAYLYERNGTLYSAVFVGKQAKPIEHYRHRDAVKREKSVTSAFVANRERAALMASRKAERQTKAAEFAAAVEVGDIFHYSFGYDETHHVFYEITEIKGRYATVRKIQQAQRQLGYDDRHQCMPQSGAFSGPATRVLLQDGRIKVDGYHHASKWNTRRVAGVPVGPSYTGGGLH